MTRSSGFGTSQISFTPSSQRLRVGAVHVEVVVGGVGEVADRALGEHRRLGDDVGAGLEVAELLALLAAAAVAGAHALDDPVLDQQLGRGGLGEDVDAGLFGFLGEEAAQFRDRDRVGALFAEVGRRRLQRERFLRGEEVGRVLGHLLVDRRPVGRVEVGEELVPSPRGRRWRRRAGARRRLCPSRSPRPGLRRASRSAPARPRAAASVCWRRRARRGRRRRSRRRPRSARPRDRSAGRSRRRCRTAAGTRSVRRQLGSFQG